MFTSLTSLKRWSGLLLAFLLIALSIVGPVGASPGDKSRGSKLSPRGQELLAEARARGDKTVRLLVASKAGANRAVAAGIAGLGGTIEYREDDIDYLRASVPIDRVEAVASLNGVEAVDLDEVIPLDDPRPDGAVNPTPQIPPGASTPNNNPYLPIGDTGASQFMAANPNWDGRGVTSASSTRGSTWTTRVCRRPAPASARSSTG